MSLVGPRPIVRDEIVKYGEYINDFYLVPPGITGVWQVSGRSDTTYEERVLMDSWYVHNWSVWIDIVYLLKTVLANRKGPINEIRLFGSWGRPIRCCFCP